MGFASTYLESRALFPVLIKEAPDSQTGIIVVVPAYNEPGIVKMLDSLALCSEPACKTEVIIVVNAPPDASEESIRNNEITINNIESWKRENRNCFFRLFAFIVQPVIAGWGVGLARKTGMDEAVRRFNQTGNHDGVILNLDADCTVEQNYFTAVCNELLMRKGRNACSVYFEHPVSGNEFPQQIYKSIVLYELHLRYYFQALAYAGFPFVYHTVGSAFAVKAMFYIKVGGMNRKQAGEDFYFIQKLVSEGGYFSLNSTVVYPSPRDSFRVPFGTGASVSKLYKENIPALNTYNPTAFDDIRLFFSMKGKYFLCKSEELTALYQLIPESLKCFIGKDEWIEKIMEIKNNTSVMQSFEKRFFGWFNMFRIVKYLNFVHQDIFEKKNIEIAASELLKKTGSGTGFNYAMELLTHYRMLEKNH